MRRHLAVALTFAALLAACGGGDDTASPPTPEGSPTPVPTPAAEQRAYFEAMKTALGETHAEYEGLLSVLLPAFDEALPEGDRTAAVTAYGDGYVVYAQATQARIASVTPPPGAGDAHAALTAAAAALGPLGDALQTSLTADPVTDETAFNDVFFQADGAAIEQRFRDACRDLQSYANDLNAGVDYQCTR